ncbi:MAG: Rrf2 family transcriptional regulator [Proteobacteria bacterium]|jgi:Rrf2 family nitric oxide-sensitive transcriptional repressor|nr:MAG: Rrf2 family transcriptional regulator [Pseudomonadota bacterium]
MRLTKQTSHAIRILIHCAHARGELVKVADIAESLGLTQQNVFKIVHILTRAKFLKAVRGRHGGVRLAQDPSAIRIGDVVRATEVTHVAIEGEVPTKGRGKGKEQPISRVLDNALEAFISVLDQHTLADMAGTPPLRDEDETPEVQVRERKRAARPHSAVEAVAGKVLR